MELKNQVVVDREWDFMYWDDTDYDDEWVDDKPKKPKTTYEDDYDDYGH